jgi:hypothetical protein
MKLRLAPLVLLLAAPAAATPPEPAPLNLQQATALKCSAAFAIVAASQARGGGAQWPALAASGREFFVRTSARIMDEMGWSRDLVALKLGEQAKELGKPGALEAAMPPCMLLLDASGI